MTPGTGTPIMQRYLLGAGAPRHLGPGAGQPAGRRIVSITNERQCMFSHIMIGSNDLERSKRFYDAVLGMLGAGEPFQSQAPTGHHRIFYRHNGGVFCITEPIDGAEATCANGATIGFKCDSPE